MSNKSIKTGLLINSIEDIVTNLVNDLINNINPNDLDISQYGFSEAVYLGVFDVEPTKRPNGNELINGDFFFNPIDNKFYVFIDGSWIDVTGSGGVSIPSPSILIDDVVNENQQVIGSFMICSDCSINITAEKGTISDINYDDNTFVYTAPDITNEEDTTDTISAYAIFDGNSSNETTKEITIKYVPPMTSDDLIQNTDFYTNQQYSQNIEY